LNTISPTDDISRARAYALDPVLWTRDVVGWTSDPWQAKLLHSEATLALADIVDTQTYQLESNHRPPVFETLITMQ
jgi:hypothetical protein